MSTSSQVALGHVSDIVGDGLFATMPISRNTKVVEMIEPEVIASRNLLPLGARAGERWEDSVVQVGNV